MQRDHDFGIRIYDSKNFIILRIGFKYQYFCYFSILFIPFYLFFQFSRAVEFFCLFVFVDAFFQRKLGIPIGILPSSGAGIDGNAPYQAQELQITTLANPGIQRNFLSTS